MQTNIAYSFAEPAVIDPRNFTSSSAFDALGRVVQTTNTDGGTQTHSYNKRDEAVSFTDPANVTSSFVRNGFGDMIQEVSPDRGTSTYTYDANGQMVTATDGRGQRIDYVYDIAGRIVSKTPVGRPASETISYAYDGAGVGGGLGGYQLGQLTSVSDSSGVTRFGYDHRGNLLQRTQSVGATAAASLTCSYDLADRITQITYPSSRSVRYGYDAKGRVSGVDTRASAAAAWVTLASNMTYQPFGAVETMALGNGLITANERGLDGRLRGRRLTNASSAASPVGTKLSDISYGYDPDGNVTSMEDKVTPARSSLYGYDAASRVNLMVAEGSNAPASYTYTPGTNKLASITTSVASGPSATRTVQYDARGNPASETRNNGSGSTQAVTLAYDGHGRMTSYARSGEVALTHSYNGNDDRISTTTTSAATATPDTRRFVYAPDGRVIGEYGSSASDVKAEFIWMNPQVGASGSFGGDDGTPESGGGGYMPLAVAANDNIAPGTTQLLWVHANHMGVPAVYTDASGAVIAPPAGYSAPGFPGQSRTLMRLSACNWRRVPESNRSTRICNPVHSLPAHPPEDQRCVGYAKCFVSARGMRLSKTL